MGKRARTAGWLVAGGVGLLLVLSLIALARQPWKQVARLPDGRVLTLAGTTYGEHRITVGEWWQKLLGPVLPKELAAGTLDLSPGNAYARDPLVFWLMYDAERIRQRQQRIGWAAALAEFRQASYPWVTAVDERGDTVGPLPFSSLSSIPSHKGVLYAALGAFPRRGSQVRIQFHRPGTSEPVAELIAANPVPGPHPEWLPEPLPARKQVGDLECALTDVVTGLTRRGGAAPVGTPPFTQLVFRTTRGGKPEANWEPLLVTLSDATGNQITPWEGEYSRRGDAGVLRMSGALSVREAAWKIRVELARRARAPFAPEETWTVRGVRVPRPKQSTGVGAVRKFGEAELRFTELIGPDNVWFKPRVRVAMRGKYADRRLTVIARDDRGRTFAGYGTTNSGRQQLREEQCDFFLNLPPDSRTLDLTFALQQSRYVEFLAKPRLP